MEELIQIMPETRMDTFAKTEKAEFDAVAPNYASMHESSLGRFATEQAYFAEYKVIDVCRELAQRGELDNTRRIIDFGAGCGQSIPYFRRHLPGASLTCSDVSEESLAIADSQYGDLASYSHLKGRKIASASDTFDVGFSACVFHHIDHAEHNLHLLELRRVIRKGGHLFIFEHNPLNPMTVRIVNRCPFDENAHLIHATEMRRRVEAAGFVDAEVRYRLFVPPFLQALRPVERLLAWLPLGAQYFVVARKPSADEVNRRA